MKLIKCAALAVLLAAVPFAAAVAQEGAIRRSPAERAPQLQKIDEVNKTPMPGLFEVRTGTEVFYANGNGNFLLRGHLFDTRLKRDLTQERQDKLLAIDFTALPVKDAFTIVRGNGKRKLAVFEDPNCGYCKRFERDLKNVDNVTVYMFLHPILGADSVEKSRNLWCTKDKGRAWGNWCTAGREDVGQGDAVVSWSRESRRHARTAPSQLPGAGPPSQPRDGRVVTCWHDGWRNSGSSL